MRYRHTNKCFLLSKLHHQEGSIQNVGNLYHTCAFCSNKMFGRTSKRFSRVIVGICLKGLDLIFLIILDNTFWMVTASPLRLREEGSLNERTLKRAMWQNCVWIYEDFQTAEIVQDSTMRTLQLRFRKEDDKNTCLQKSVDTLMTVGRIVRRTREQHKLHRAHLYKNLR
ncbi:hypothetical protein CEXT_325181 [Caerostris extrusa]|uniref:Uncharacterized protein n=1 Tax=Caerostris extrusa TaxID=172846 RepID=A0AAV4RSX8_CAEEX|nr:hypothetical protein CEXT_325181 [Caerostris extrusa]